MESAVLLAEVVLGADNSSIVDWWEGDLGRTFLGGTLDEME